MNRNKFNPHKLDRDGKPYNVVPKRLRVRVYKILHEKIVVQKNNLGGLCVVLANTLHDIDPKYPPFLLSVDTDLLFPEFGEYIVKYTVVKYEGMYRGYEDVGKQEWRRIVLEEIINKI